MVFLGTSSCASGHKKTLFQVLCFYLLVRTQDVCYTNRLMRTIQKSSLWWSFLLLQRIYEDFFVGTWKCPHNLNRPHFAGVYTYECPHKCAKVHAHNRYLQNCDSIFTVPLLTQEYKWVLHSWKMDELSRGYLGLANFPSRRGNSYTLTCYWHWWKIQHGESLREHQQSLSFNMDIITLLYM